MGLADSERAALADLLQEVGPDRPTLCAGWTTGDLLAHLIVRERRPDGAVGLLIPPLQGFADRVRQDVRRRPWAEQLTVLRTGPPWWNPMRWGPLAELTNGAEFFIHHEDARRGVDGWTPRRLDRATEDAVAGLVDSGFMRVRFRRSPAGLTAVMPDREPVTWHRGEPMVRVHGDPAEVVLWSAGRDAAVVSVQGDPAAVRAVQAMSRRM